MILELVKTLHSAYGRRAFDLVCLLTIWIVCVRPFTSSTQHTAEAFAAAAVHMHATAETLADELQRIEARRVTRGESGGVRQ